MASKKRKTPVKREKTTVKKHKIHAGVKKKELVEELPQKQESQETVLPQPQALVVDSKPEVSKEPSSEPQPEMQQPQILQSQPQTQPPQPQEQPQPQLSDQITGVLPSQPESAASRDPSTGVSQEPSSFSGVVRDTQTQDIEQPKNKKLWIVIAIVIISVFLVGGALWYFRENVMKRAAVKDVTPVPSVLKNTPTPATDSAKLEIDFSKYKIKVLNGSGIGGEAARTRDILSDEEFNVEEIGNADKLDYEGTIIMAKADVPREFLDKLKSVLEETYLLDASEELESTEDIDVVIIIGSSKQPK